MSANDRRSIVAKQDFEVFDTSRVAKTLHTAMEEMLKKEISPASLNAACNCAQQITNILRLHLDAKRLKSRLKNMGVE